jgi:hypothetical protein
MPRPWRSSCRSGGSWAGSAAVCSRTVRGRKREKEGLFFLSFLFRAAETTTHPFFFFFLSLSFSPLHSTPTGLSRSGGRYLLTSGATLIAAPVLAFNVLAPDHRASFAALLVGFGLSEMWRAPAAVMVRDVSPPDLGSTGSAVHLCVRNLVGGLGPLGEL